MSYRPRVTSGRQRGPYLGRVPGLGAVLREARGDRSLRSVAREAGIDHESYRRIEEGRSGVALVTLVRLGVALGLEDRIFVGWDKTVKVTP